VNGPFQLLVVVTTPVEDDVLRREVRRLAGDGAKVKVVAPATVSAMDWLTNADDDARAEAKDIAEGAVEGLDSAELTSAEVGDNDPVQAIEDALRIFPADEILVVTRPEQQADWLEKGVFEDDLSRFGVPVAHLVVPGNGQPR
jgi:GABA permease